VGSLLAGGPNVQHPDLTGRPAAISLICGVFLLRDTQFNPLTNALPALVHANLARTGDLHNLSGVAHLLVEELRRTGTGGSYVAERLLEVLCAEAIRAHVETQGQEAGWLRAIQDVTVGRALLAIHADPGIAWSVERLARLVAMSPSRFAARFSATMGHSPMAYVTRWRMNIACRKLAASRQPIAQIATEAGYDSPAAFNRAFRKLTGLGPAAWRKANAGEERTLSAQ
jgi:AraC-like DNA-binding protein